LHGLKKDPAEGEIMEEYEIVVPRKSGNVILSQKEAEFVCEAVQHQENIQWAGSLLKQHIAEYFDISSVEMKTEEGIKKFNKVFEERLGFTYAQTISPENEPYHILLDRLAEEFEEFCSTDDAADEEGAWDMAFTQVCGDWYRPADKRHQQ
jgi:hypothetical protein